MQPIAPERDRRRRTQWEAQPARVAQGRVDDRDLG
jgi:hypothetical protein